MFIVGWNSYDSICIVVGKDIVCNLNWNFFIINWVNSIGICLDICFFFSKVCMGKI